jgi:PleD family two-component response regulator
LGAARKIPLGYNPFAPNRCERIHHRIHRHNKKGGSVMGKKILIVDDEPEQIDFATILLEESDYIPISASDGREGIEKAKSEKPDLILLI